MSKSSRYFLGFIRVLCAFSIIWYGIYFFWGEKFSITFSDSVFSAWFPQILVFLCAVSIYGLFILSIKSQQKKWQNILLFIGGFLLATLPFLIYHGYFQPQCGIWNKEVVKETPVYYNKLNKFETIKIIESHCKKTITIDTLYIKQVTPYFELQNPVSISKSENSNWIPIR